MSIKRDKNNKIINSYNNIAQMSIPQLMWFNKSKLLSALMGSLEDLKDEMIQVFGSILSLITIILFPVSLLVIAYVDRKRSREHMEQWGKSWK